MSNFYNEILTDHNIHPVHKHELSCCTCTRDGVNPSCGDEITLNLSIGNGIITDGSFTGSGCAVSQASADIMLDLVIGKSTGEALRLHELFMKMICAPNFLKSSQSIRSLLTSLCLTNSRHSRTARSMLLI